MWEWLGRVFRRGTEDEDDEQPDVELDIYERVDRLEESLQRLDERTRKQRYRDGQGTGADVAARQVPNSAGPDRRKVDLLNAFNAARRQQ